MECNHGVGSTDHLDIVNSFLFEFSKAILSIVKRFINIGILVLIKCRAYGTTSRA